MSSVREVGEFPLIARLTRKLPTHPDLVETIGDDCAVVRVGQELLLLTCDASVENVHFTTRHLTPEAIGWRAAASAISDIGAMGGSPRFLLVTLATPPECDAALLEGIYEGISAAAAETGAMLAGGDVVRSTEGIFIDVMVVGAAGQRYVTRRGVQQGDLIAVTGWPGRAGAGWAALQRKLDLPEVIEVFTRPHPRIREGQWLARHDAVHAMIDVSDGVWPDAAHLSENSGVGIELRRDLLPIAPALAAAALKLDADAAELVFTGGEDYELLCALAPDEAEALCRGFEAEHGLPLSIIGVATAKWQGMRLDGRAWKAPGFTHFE